MELLPYLTPLNQAHQGSVKDEDIAVKMPTQFSERDRLQAALGYVVFQFEKVYVPLPIQKKKNPLLSQVVQGCNPLRAKRKTSLEQVKSEVKRLRIVTEKMYLKTRGVLPTLMRFACSAYNRRNNYNLLTILIHKP